jgi:NAD(P)-dependent dehydrogenase (short-subunit alcohol dehydrogenase family)
VFSLDEKTVVVTGGGRGIGRGIARAMAKSGANVVITGRSAEPLADTRTELESLGAQVLVVQGDICSHEAIESIVSRTQDRFGRIHGWVNNAGSAAASDVGPLLDLREDQWDRVVDLNLKWTFFAAQAAARVMTEGGSILNISSRSGSQPCPNTGQYGAAKAGIDNLTATMAVEWGHLGIRVNAIAPGVVITENSGSMSNERRRRRQIETVPMRRLGVVDDVGPLAVYFVADESEWVTGTVVPVTGGSRIPVGLLSYLHHVNRRMEET